MNKPNYFSILPASVRYNKNLTDFCKILFSELTALSNKNGFCNAKNDYFSELYNKSDRSITRSLSKLKDENFINIEIKKTAAGTFRKIYPILTPNPPDKNDTPTRQNCQNPPDKIVKTHPTKLSSQKNNTSINNTSINKSTHAQQFKPATSLKLYEVTLASYNWPPQISQNLKNVIISYFDYMTTRKPRFGGLQTVAGNINKVVEYLRQGFAPDLVAASITEAIERGNVTFNPAWTRARQEKEAAEKIKAANKADGLKKAAAQLENNPDFFNLL